MRRYANIIGILSIAQSQITPSPNSYERLKNEFNNITNLEEAQ